MGNRGSMIEKPNTSGYLMPADDEGALWAIFEFIESFSFVSHLAVEKIPIDETKK